MRSSEELKKEWKKVKIASREETDQRALTRIAEKLLKSLVEEKKMGCGVIVDPGEALKNGLYPVLKDPFECGFVYNKHLDHRYFCLKCGQFWMDLIDSMNREIEEDEFDITKVRPKVNEILQRSSHIADNCFDDRSHRKTASDAKFLARLVIKMMDDK